MVEWLVVHSHCLLMIFQDGNAFQVGLSYIYLLISCLCLCDVFIYVCLQRFPEHLNKTKKHFQLSAVQIGPSVSPQTSSHTPMLK